VQVTDPNPAATTKDPRLTLYKWWPGAHATFNVNTASQWNAVVAAVEELLPYLKWTQPDELASSLRVKDGKALDKELKRAAAADPSIVGRILKGIDFKKIDPEDLPDVARHLSTIGTVLVEADRDMRAAIEQVVKKLPAQGPKATEGLAQLMEQLTLRQIMAVTTEVQRRVDALVFFKNRMLDDRTYEIRGDNSIHRLLESAMWIVDERYWLMNSNEPLRTVVGRELEKSDKAHERKRPDFVCGTVDCRLIVIEIKRPSHTLGVDDLNQLERYVTICEEYSEDFSSLEAAILVGSNKSDDLMRHIRHRSTSFKVRTYTDLVHDTERRYRAYLDAHADTGS
jgi:hypothetical protein